MTLETVPNDLDDTIHRALDHEVPKNAGTDIEPSTLANAVLLLDLIVSNSERRLDPQYLSATARRILEQYPAWQN
jgi:hypothetical protein